MNAVKQHTTEATVPVPVRLDIDTVAPHFMRELARLDAAASAELDAAGIPPGIRDLIRLRASQLNGCAYCVDTHGADAATAGEPFGRIAAVAVWRESPFFSRSERAMLEITEAITVARGGASDDVWANAAAVLSPTQLGAVIALAVAVNAWNAVGATTHAWTPTLDAH